MKFVPHRALALFAAFLGLTRSVTAAVPDGLIHRWSFNGNLVDSVGGSHATIETPVLATAVNADLTSNPGQVTLAGGLQDYSSYVSLGSNLIGGSTGPITIEIWATQRKLQEYSRIFDFGSGLTENLNMAWNRATLATDSVLFARSATQVYSNDTNAPYTLNVPYHIVMTIVPGAGVDGSCRFSWYSARASSVSAAVVRGTFDSGYSLVGLADQNDWLGRSQALVQTASASYDEVRIYDRVLSAAEVLAHRRAGPNSIITDPPVAVPDAAILPRGGQVTLDVLTNDQGVSLGDATVTLVTPPASGTASVLPNGRIHYVHNGNSALTDTFTYKITDILGASSLPAAVVVTFSSSLRLPASTLEVPAEPPPLSLEVVDAFPTLSFQYPLCIRNIPGETTRLFVAERRGVISYIPDTQAADPEKKVLLDISSLVSYDGTNEGELGLLGFAFHPNFASNGYVYVFYTAPGTPYYDRLSRFTVTRAANGSVSALPSSEKILINQIDEAFNHNAGDTHFGPDGYLYISMGDEGEQMNQSQNSQRIDKDLFGAILRIDVDKNPSTSIEPNPHPSIPTDGGIARFSVPKSNPFVGTALGGDWNGLYNGEAVDASKVRTEFWCTGIRSPWRMSFDSAAPYELWLGDVGQDSWEEVDVITRGGNYGWAFREGSHQTPGTPSTYIGSPPAAFTSIPPVWDYPHPGTSTDPSFSGQSVTGGVVYHGESIPSLEGAYVFADYLLGNIWSLRRTEGAPVVERIAGQSGISAFGIDPSNGDILMAAYTQNRIKRLVQRETIAASSTGYPQLLSQTGIFADLTTLTPNPGVVPYEPNLSFWSDHAVKGRWFALPDTTSRIGFSAGGNWTFPAGMIWVKHFEMEMERGNPASRKRLETRVLVRTDSGSYGVSYRWNDEGTDAVLSPDSGETFELPVKDGGVAAPQTWEIPSRTSCMLCHTPVAGHALSFNTRQLDRQGSIAGLVGNQLDLLEAAGYLDSSSSGRDPAVRPFLGASADYATLEYRVRSFLATNCVQCHQDGGAAPSTWDARPQLTLEETGLIRGVADRPGTDPLDRLIVPGSPDHSILLKRLQASGGFTRMPPVGTHVFDEEHIDLVRRWITEELPSRQLYDDWKTRWFPFGGVSSGRDADPDGDGLTNYQEFLQGTSPASASDTPPVVLTMGSGNQLDLQFNQVAHRFYQIESSDDLIHWSSWSGLGTWDAADDQWARWLIDPSAGHFFRLRISEP